MFKAYKLENMGCFSYEFGEMEQWLAIEIIIFYGNICVLGFVLARTRCHSVKRVKEVIANHNEDIANYV